MTGHVLSGIHDAELDDNGLMRCELHCSCGWTTGPVALVRHGLIRLRSHQAEESENCRRPALGPDGGKETP